MKTAWAAGVWRTIYTPQHQNASRFDSFCSFFRKLWKLLLFSCLHDYHRLSLANFTETPQSWIARITGPILHFCCELSGLAQVFFIFFILLTSFGLMLGPWSVIPDLDMSETALCVRTYLNTCIYIHNWLCAYVIFYVIVSYISWYLP